MAEYRQWNASGRWDRESWSYILGHWQGIRVRVSILLIVFLVFELLRGYHDSILGYTAMMGAALFGSVLLHEFGHCFGCRAVGGKADDILLWPLGGLAYCDPPRRPLENLITTASGPLVNVALCLITFPLLWLLGVGSWSYLNPFMPPSPVESAALTFLILLFWLNYILLLFNLLPVFPFDGGAILRELLWFRMSHHQATVIATNVGMIGAVIFAGVALWNNSLLLAGVAVFGFAQCVRIRKETELMGEIIDNEFGYDFSQGYTSLERSLPDTQKKIGLPSFRDKYQSWQQRRRDRQAAQLEAELDRILEKIHVHGMESLSNLEKRTLTQASEKRRS